MKFRIMLEQVKGNVKGLTKDRFLGCLGFSNQAKAGQTESNQAQLMYILVASNRPGLHMGNAF